MKLLWRKERSIASIMTCVAMDGLSRGYMTDSMNWKAESRRQKAGGESHPREWVDRSSPAYNETRRDSSSESHPRERLYRSNPAYNEPHRVSSFKYYPRECFDRSRLDYQGTHRDSCPEPHL